MQPHERYGRAKYNVNVYKYYEDSDIDQFSFQVGMTYPQTWTGPFKFMKLFSYNIM